jgi:hypothetical protein
MPRLKTKHPFAEDQVVIATKTFATESDVVHAGEKYRGGDRVVRENHSAFVDGDTLPSELPNFWNELPPPPAPEQSKTGFRVTVTPSTTIPVHRQVKSRVDHFFPSQWAPSSAGEKSGVPPPFGTALSKGQVKDILDPIVVANPSWFEFPARDILSEDIERLDARRGRRMANPKQTGEPLPTAATAQGDDPCAPAR